MSLLVLFRIVLLIGIWYLPCGIGTPAYKRPRRTSDFDHIDCFPNKHRQHDWAAIPGIHSYQSNSLSSDAYHHLNSESSVGSKPGLIEGEGFQDEQQAKFLSPNSLTDPTGASYPAKQSRYGTPHPYINQHQHGNPYGYGNQAQNSLSESSRSGNQHTEYPVKPTTSGRDVAIIVPRTLIDEQDPLEVVNELQILVNSASTLSRPSADNLAAASADAGYRESNAKIDPRQGERQFKFPDCDSHQAPAAQPFLSTENGPATQKARDDCLMAITQSNRHENINRILKAGPRELGLTQILHSGAQASAGYRLPIPLPVSLQDPGVSNPPVRAIKMSAQYTINLTRLQYYYEPYARTMDEFSSICHLYQHNDLRTDFTDIKVTAQRAWRGQVMTRPNMRVLSPSGGLVSPQALAQSLRTLIIWVLRNHQKFLERMSPPQTQLATHEELLTSLHAEIFCPINHSLPVLGESQRPIHFKNSRDFGLVQKKLINHFYTPKKHYPGAKTSAEIIGIWYKNSDPDWWKNVVRGDEGYWLIMRQIIDREERVEIPEPTVPYPLYDFYA